jgi:type II secretory pathway pseudopilin PulG
MDNYLFIFFNLFILIVIIIIIILLYYFYKNYKNYKKNIDANLSISESTLNNATDTFDKLQDEINDKLNELNKKNSDFIVSETNKLNSINSNLNTNLNKLFKVNSFNDYINSNLSNKNDISINTNSKITNYSSITNLTDNNNYFKICDNSIDESKRKCINLNVDSSGNFNIYPGLDNSNSSNVASVSIYNKNKNVLAKFDLNSNSISLGSDTNPAISITNNIYTPNIIVCNYTFNMATSSEVAKINLNYISNFILQKGTYLNFMINTTYNFYLSTFQNDNNYIDIYKISYDNNIIKLFIKNQIPSNAIINLSLNIITYDSNNPIYNILTPNSTNGFLTTS